MAFPQTGGATKCCNLSSNVCRHETLWVAVNYPMKLICRILLEILKASAVIFTKTSWNFIVIAGLFMTPRMFKVGDWPFNVNFFIHLQIDNKSYFYKFTATFSNDSFHDHKNNISGIFFSHQKAAFFISSLSNRKKNQIRTSHDWKKISRCKWARERRRSQVGASNTVRTGTLLSVIMKSSMKQSRRHVGL